MRLTGQDVLKIKWSVTYLSNVLTTTEIFDSGNPLTFNRTHAELIVNWSLDYPRRLGCDGILRNDYGPPKAGVFTSAAI
jgi:hypothetical protein